MKQKANYTIYQVLLPINYKNINIHQRKIKRLKWEQMKNHAIRSHNRKRIQLGNSVRTQPPPPAPVNLETSLYFNVVRRTVSIDAWLTPIHWSKPWFISINSASFSSFSIRDKSSWTGDWIRIDNSLLIESTALNTELIASGCLMVLSETPATKAFVFLPTLVFVISIFNGMFDLMRVKLPDLNLIMLPDT